MLIKIILSYLIGFLRIEVTGYYLERFINLCNVNKILIWNIKKETNSNMLISANIKEIKKIIKIARKTNCRIRIKKKKGIPFLIKKYKKRKMLLILFFILVILIIILSKFIWNVEIIIKGDGMENIQEDLENAGLQIGTLKSNINTKEIINKIRLKRNDIAWIGINIVGTNAKVEIEKAVEKPEIIDENDFTNIVASKDGTITKINAQKGTIQVSVGEEVTKDSILIGGWMEGKYTGIRYVHSIGEVEAKVGYTKSKKISYKSIKKQNTGNEEVKYAIKIHNLEINLGKRVSKFKIYDTIEENKKIQIYSNYYLPITIRKTIFKEQEEVEENYTIEEAKNKAIVELEKEFENEIVNKENIVNQRINTEEDDDGINVIITYEIIENIGINKKI